MRDASMDKEEIIKFRKSSASRSRSRNLFQGFFSIAR